VGITPFVRELVMAKKKVNKTQLIKEAITATPEAAPKEIAETLKKHGITATYVSNVKGKLNAKPKKRRRKGAAKSPGRPAATADTLDAAVKFVEQSGGLKAAKAAIEKIERIKSL
jgi:CBS domain-containing protein